MLRVAFLLAASAIASSAAMAAPLPSVGSVRPEASEFRQLVATNSAVSLLADGFTWTEGPVWIRPGGYLLFSDPPENRMYRWDPRDRSARLFLEPSGSNSSKGFREAGSNGLKPAGDERLLVADEGDRGIALLDLSTKSKRILVDRFQGKRLNSPNDIAVGADHAIWFTDPPYGLEGVDASPLKEQTANRVYRLDPDGRLSAIESQLRYPNGIAFSPDGRTLYVSNSDPQNAVILAWEVSPKGRVSHRRLFADMTPLVARGLVGVPDGMCVDEHANLWASGPGGIHVFTPRGREIGLISTGTAISNCTFGGSDGRTLFMTSTHRLVALRTRVRGARLRIPRLPKSGP